MNPEIPEHVKRIVGGEGVGVTDVETESEANPRVRMETANATYELPANRVLSFLESLPDDIGVEALRQAIEERFPASSV